MSSKRSIISIVLLVVVSLFVMMTVASAESFVGSASGYGGSIRVTVEVVNGKIANITASGKGETEGIGSVAVEKLAVAMMEAKTWDVDTITGATITSNAMKEAAQKAMVEAGIPDGESAEAASEPTAYIGTASGYGGSIRVTLMVLDGQLIELTATGKGETEGIGSVAVEKLAEAMMEAKTWDVDVITGATITSNAMKEASQKAMTEAGLLNDETEAEAVSYTGSASGYGGTVRITIDVADGKIVNITTSAKGETEGIGSVAVVKLAEAMLEAQDWDVDAITGATITSVAAKDAAKKAMTEAGLIP